MHMCKTLRTIYLRYKKSSLSDECGGPQIYVLGGFAILLLMGLFTTFGYAYKIQIMASNLNYGTKLAATTAFGIYAVPEIDRFGIKIVDASGMQQEFKNILQDQMKDWPQSTYTLQSFQVYGESDRGASPPTGFAQPIPGTSVYIKMDFNIEINPGFIPMNTHWTIPLYVMVSSNSYESATGAWNLVR
ncbi:hypothetical protein [Desulfosporosinus sp.]|uniref:hypothetical protein n=1 Tax=Desulfosporosinus sp. TaxID=157907 RepID=UPI00262E08B7|nr:hypothetical protein [Desulfosporosinus sp.]